MFPVQKNIDVYARESAAEDRNQDKSSEPNFQPSFERLEARLDEPQSEGRVEPRPDLSTSIVSEQIIPLLEERLVVGRQKRKVGEVIFRKEIETQIVEIPIRREKLIVEQVSPEYKQLVVIDLGQALTQRDALEAVDTIVPKTVSGRFISASAAIQFLEAIAAQSNPGLQTMQVSIILEDAALQATYQQWLEQ